MTEAEWLEFADLFQKLDYLRPCASERKLRLFAFACLRRVAVTRPSILDLNELNRIECFADSHSFDAEMHRLRLSLGIRNIMYLALKPKMSVFATIRTSDAVLKALDYSGEELGHLADYLREIFGNPFRPVEPDQKWFEGRIQNIGQTIYTERRFDAKPILADAFEEAGCSDAAILAHCREKREHVRGCWVLDLLLGKS